MKVLVVDDEADILEVVEGILRASFPLVEPVCCSGGQEALDALEQQDISLIVTDLLMPRLDGEALLAEVRGRWPQIPVLIMSAHGTIEKAVSLLQAGARDFITKPFVVDDLVHRVGLALETVSLQAELRRMREALSSDRRGDGLLYASSAMKEMLDRARLVAQSHAPVLITGESGTGKELLARQLHRWGPRRDGPYVAVNCGAFTESLLEAELFGHEKGAFTGAVRGSTGVIREADGGTLFLDEIGETSPTFQVKLLRFLQEGEVRPVGRATPNSVDTRVIAATNQDLASLMQRGRFRPDLYYRLNVIPLELPPLRERPEDILLLSHHFIRSFGREAGREMFLSPEATQRLMEHPWPGNVRELENKMRQLAVLAPAERVEAAHLDLEPARRGDSLSLSALSFAPGLPFKDARRATLDRFERAYVEDLLRRHQGHPSPAAEEAGLDRKGLWRLMKKHGLVARRFRR